MFVVTQVFDNGFMQTCNNSKLRDNIYGGHLTILVFIICLVTLIKRGRNFPSFNTFFISNLVQAKLGTCCVGL